ncbi:MAG: RagB/SusD family nutrient uptake outer membrane protein [Alistipes putredinis]|nr:MAG: RagB/SusD family nutrient uptake outer membrane protein [Alistipes putredinis]
MSTRHSRSLYTGEFLYHPDYQSDLFTELSTSGNRGGSFARWSLMTNDSDIERVWNMHYAAITNANLFIGGVDNVIEKADNEDDKAALSVMKGEMYLLRAMSFRQLALHFCKDYEPETAASEFGVPIVETFDLGHKPHRGTLANTYARITKDIEEAERLITTPGASNAKYLTADCVTAFKAQVYLDMHRYEEASQAAQSLYSKYNLAQSAADIESMWRQDLSSETIFQFAIGKTEIVTDDPRHAFHRLPRRTAKQRCMELRRRIRSREVGLRPVCGRRLAHGHCDRHRVGNLDERRK